MWRLKPNDWKLFGPLPIEMGGSLSPFQGYVRAGSHQLVRTNFVPVVPAACSGMSHLKSAKVEGLPWWLRW